MNPDDLLAQIMDLCQQYIQAGGDPSQVMDAVAQAAQGGDYGGGDQGMGVPPPAGGGMPPTDEAPMMSGDTALPDMTGGMPLDQQQSGGFKDFGSAQAALAEEMKKKMTRAR
jgi:hypothetical protein